RARFISISSALISRSSSGLGRAGASLSGLGAWGVRAFSSVFMADSFGEKGRHARGRRQPACPAGRHGTRPAGLGRVPRMAWVKVPPENHSKFYDALPDDPRVEPMKMFGGVAAKVNGRIFGGLFGRSVMLWLPEPDRAEALALEGASPFDPMGDGRASDKVMLPERVMNSPPELRAWLRRAFEATATLPPK